jgi:hypothetical protein
MNRFYVFIIRAVFGTVFAVVLTRIFYPETNIIYVVGLGVFLVGMAYLTEYFRNRKSG